MPVLITMNSSLLVSRESLFCRFSRCRAQDWEIPKRHTLPSVGVSSEPENGKISSQVNSELKRPTLPASLSRPAFSWPDQGCPPEDTIPSPVSVSASPTGRQVGQQTEGSCREPDEPGRFKYCNRSHRKRRACQNMPFSCLYCVE